MDDVGVLFVFGSIFVSGALGFLFGAPYGCLAFGSCMLVLAMLLYIRLSRKA